MNKVARKTPNKLQILQSTLLCNWLSARTLVPNDTHAKLAEAAAQELSIPNISATHVGERLRALGLSIPVSTMTPESQQKIMREDIRALARLVIALAHYSTLPIPRELTERINAIAND